MLLLAIALLAYVSIGLPDGLHGVAWPFMRQTLGLPLAALGGLLAPALVGYLLASFGSGAALGRVRLATLLVVSVLAAATALLGFALAPAWGYLLPLSLLLGLGGGAIDAGLNVFAASAWGVRTLNGLHAAYGLGATLGPLVMTGVLAAGLTWRWGYGLVGLALVLLAGLFGLTRGWWMSAAGQGTAERPAAIGRTLRRPIAWLGMLVFFVYTGVEAATGQWAFTLLAEGRGLPVTVAGFWASVYWGSFTLGRVLFGAVWPRTSDLWLLRLCLVGAIVGALLVWRGGPGLVTLAGLVLLGLALAPVFPALIAATPGRLGAGHAANAIGFQVAAAALGASVLSAGAGLLGGLAGLDAIPLAVVVAAAGLLVLHEALVVAGGRAPACEGARGRQGG